MYKICVYAIAKNESKNVEEWVKSMSPADHIIVLDTGSTDDTVEKLRSLGVEVHEKHYDHFRFDVARNDCLDLVPDDYDILVSIDLDERFEDPNWANIVKENWDPNRPRMTYNYVWNHSESGEPGTIFLCNKIHSKTPNLRWEGAAHEHLWYQDAHTRLFTDEQSVFLGDKIVVHHYSDFEKDRSFYTDLLEERVQESPDDGYSWIMLGNEYRSKEEWEKAIDCYERCFYDFAEQYDLNTYCCLYYWLGFCYWHAGDAVVAWNLFSEGIAKNPFYRDNYYGLAIIMLGNHLLELALGTVLEALKTSKRLFCWMEDPLTWTFGMYDLLAAIYAEQGKIDLALQAEEIALNIDPSDEFLIESYNRYKQLYENQKESQCVF